MTKNLSKRQRKIRTFFKQAYSVMSLRHSAGYHAKLAQKIETLGLTRLHVGCGNILLDGWLNVTFEPKDRVYGELIKVSPSGYLLNYDVLRGLPVADQSQEFVAAAHFIEHLDLNHGLKFVSEVFKKLKKGGRLRLSCPDLEIYAANFINRNNKFYSNTFIKDACTFQNAQTSGQIFAAKAYDSGGAHKWFYDAESLINVLTRCGFSEVKKCGRLESKISDVERIELPEREIETLYVEGVKR